MLAPVVAVAIVTLTELSKFPPFGLNAGVAAAAFFVNVAEETVLFVRPLFTAIAFSVVVEEMAIGAEYTLEPVVGVLPSVV